MTGRSTAGVLAAFAAALLAVAGCGVKAPPRPPLREPAPVQQPAAQPASDPNR